MLEGVIMEPESRIGDVEILMMAGLIDVLEVYENMDNIEEIRDDIKRRKKLLKKEIKYVEKNKKTYYSKDEIEKVLKSIKIILQKNEWLYAKEYVDILLEKVKDQ